MEGMLDRVCYKEKKKEIMVKLSGIKNGAVFFLEGYICKLFHLHT